MKDVDRQSEIISLMRQVLGDKYTHFVVRRVVIEENLEGSTTSVTCEAQNEITGAKNIIAGKGVGLVDAFFSGLVERFAQDYPSLKTIQFSSFSVKAELGTKQAYSGTDSQAKVTLEITNSEDKRFYFSHESRSLTTSAILTTLAAVEYFINSECAFVMTHNALKDAQQRKRSDLVQRFTNTLAMLVQNTSYSEVIDKIRQDIAT